MSTPTEIVPPAEVQSRLGISETTYYKGLKAGEVPGGRRIGGRYLVIRAVFERELVDGVRPDTPIERDDPRNPFLRTVTFRHEDAS